MANAHKRHTSSTDDSDTEDWTMVETEDAKEDRGWTVLGVVATGVWFGLSRSSRAASSIATGAVVGISWGNYLVVGSLSIGLTLVSSFLRLRPSINASASRRVDVVIAQGDLFRSKKAAVQQLLKDPTLVDAALETDKRVLRSVSSADAKAAANSVLEQMPSGMQEAITLKDVVTNACWQDKQDHGAFEVDGRIHFLFWKTDETENGIDFACLHVKAPAGYSLAKVLAALIKKEVATFRGEDELVISKDLKKD